jgi:hypothetical protein
MTTPEINAQIAAINEIFDDFVEYNDSISFVDENQKSYTTDPDLLSSTEQANYTAIQALEELKKISLNEYTYKTVQDTTLFNLCFQFYGAITDEHIDNLINANDLLKYNTLKGSPLDPIIPKDTVITYYK